MSALSEFKQRVRELLADVTGRKQAFLCDSCPLLGYARLCQREGTLSELAAYLRENDEWQKFRNCWDDAAFAALLDARCQVIWAGADPLEQDLGKAVKAYASAWDYSPSKKMHKAFQTAYRYVTSEPAFIRHLPTGRTMDLFRSLASRNEFGPFHPGLHLVAATYAAIFSDAEPPPFTPEVTTWILLVANNSDGYASQFDLQRVARGCGALYPDACCGAYVRTEKSFQDGLQNAWWAVIGQNLRQKIEFDVRWRLWVADKNNEPLDYRLKGHSAEAGVACALMALCANERLDDDVAITAQFEKKEAGTSYTRLAAVSDVAAKLLAPDHVPVLEKKRLVEVVVHRDQEENGKPIFSDQEAQDGTTLPTKRLGERLVVTGVTHLDDAYDRLSRWGRLTRKVKERLAERAKEKLDGWCGEGEYRRSHFRAARPVDRTACETSGFPGQDRWGDRLTKEEEDRLQLGRYADHVRILGDSGIGKTAFLMSCEREIAAADDSRVPLRLTDLSVYRWDNPEALTTQLIAHFEDWVPEDDFGPWFDRLRRDGDLVILLDALDQTSEGWEALNKWLTVTGGVKTCPIVLTGRFSIERGKKSLATEGIADWSVLCVEGFDRKQQKEYLGDELYGQLVTQGEEDIETRWRKAQWAKLMGTPLLLKLIRDIASADELEHLPNKYCIYEKALIALWGRGRKSADHAGLDLGRLARWVPTNQLLGQLAWHMVQGRNFTGVVTGEAFERLCEAFELDNHLDVLDQLNIVNVETSGAECGLEWRHMSFCEYFAGVHLATALPREQQTEHIENVMRLPLPEKGEILPCRDPVGEGSDWAPGFADPERWGPIFEFALSCAQQRGDETTLNGLANDLFRCGGIRVLRDFLQFESDPDPKKPQVVDTVRELCRALGGYSIHWRRDVLPFIANRSGSDSSVEEGFKMYQETAEMFQTQDVNLDATALEMLEQLFVSRQYRRSEYLPAAWDLMHQRKKDEPEVERRMERIYAIVAKEHAELRTHLPVVEEFLNTFRPCPKRDGDKLEFTMGKEGDQFAPLRNATVRAFSLADFPVTNALFEAFDPSHVWDRDRWSRADDQPAVWVNWYQAQMFCVWLGARSQDRFRLPTEVEWEFACRANAELRTCYWWGDEFDETRCNADDRLGRTNGRREKLGDESDLDAHRNQWDLHDMLGNVWEWCEDVVGETDPLWEGAKWLFGPVWLLVVRGGTFDCVTEQCGSAFRLYHPPALRFHDTGFRVLLW